MPSTIYPGNDWERVCPKAVGMDADKLTLARDWMAGQMSEKPFRVAIVRRGKLAAEWSGNIGPEPKLPIASAAKSVYSNVLGILTTTGDKIPSPDARISDYYPEYMDVPEGTGPKEARYAYPKDGTITFRQLISNTSGYMKPGEEPGKVFNYQTYGMNVLTHAMAAAYGLYSIDDPDGWPGFKALIEDRLARKIGVQWDYSLSNFKLHDAARLGVYGYYTQILATAPDLARLGWLWCNWGRWEDEQVVPEGWLRESTRVNSDLRANCPREEWVYGYGIWTNEEGLLWPGLPKEGFTASGAGGHYCSVFPSKELVVVQNPGRYGQDAEGNPDRGVPEFLKLVLDSLEG